MKVGSELFPFHSIKMKLYPPINWSFLSGKRQASKPPLFHLSVICHIHHVGCFVVVVVVFNKLVSAASSLSYAFSFLFLKETIFTGGHLLQHCEYFP